MCGIAGVISKDPLSLVDVERLKTINSEMPHRGPDDSGLHVGTHFALAMRRLSIIDLKSGHQPLYSADRKNVLVCNGEIYNHPSLQAKVLASGYNLTTKSDCEPILPLFDEMGSRCLKLLDGMFAMSVWNENRQELMLARDRFGEKPLYIYKESGQVWFSSELKTLIKAFPEKKWTINQNAAYSFLTLQYIVEPETMFNEIQKLPRGSFMLLKPNDLSAHSEIYWNMQDAPALDSSDKKEVVKKVRSQIEKAVEKMLIADVPVGVSLSGGIDSSLIAVLASRYSGKSLKAFSVGYPGRPPNDERAMAIALSKQLNIDFFDVELAQEDFVTDFPHMIWSMDDPIGDIAAFGYSSIAKLAQKYKVPVLLSGLGADEIFWGYKWVREANKRQNQTLHPNFLSKFFGRSTKPQVNFFSYLDWVGQSAQITSDLMSLKAQRNLQESFFQNLYQNPNLADLSNWSLDFHNRTWLVSNCLNLSDRLTMRFSIESRLPFLDHHLCDLVTGLRKGGYDDSSGHKTLLIESCKDLLPAEIFNRPKMGFTPPVHNWMTSIVNRYKHLAKDGMLLSKGILNVSMENLMSDSFPLSYQYRVLMLEIWLRLFDNKTNANDLKPFGDK